jgi:hypothetical protein
MTDRIFQTFDKPGSHKNLFRGVSISHEEISKAERDPRYRPSDSRSLAEPYAELHELREGEMNDAFSRVFTLDVDGRPTLAFEASRTREAQEICKEAWLRDDLIVLSSRGVPICADRSKLSVRPATDEEVVIYKQAAELAKPFDDMVLAYLIELDI